MEENTTIATEEQEQTSDGFAEGWEDTEDLPAADQPEEDTEGADQQEEAAPAEAQEQETDPAGAAGEESQPQEQNPTAQEVPKTWTLKHMDETRTVGEAEMVTLAQKGMDYDRIRAKYDESRPVMELFGQFAKGAGVSVQDYVAQLRIQVKQAQGMNEADARRTVELEDREAAVSVKEAAEAQRRTEAQKAQAAQTEADARRQADIARFAQKYPDAAKDPKAIPPEVWAEVRKGASLVEAYGDHLLAQEKAARQAAETRAATTTKNQVNASRATGSMKSAGADTRSNDPFMEGWNSTN